MNNVAQDIFERKAEEYSAWIDTVVISLLPDFYVGLLRSSKTPNFIKCLLSRISGIEIIHRQLMGNFGFEIIIKKYGKVKARRKFL